MDLLMMYCQVFCLLWVEDIASCIMLLHFFTVFEGYFLGETLCLGSMLTSYCLVIIPEKILCHCLLWCIVINLKSHSGSCFSQNWYEARKILTMIILCWLYHYNEHIEQGLMTFGFIRFNGVGHIGDMCMYFRIFIIVIFRQSCYKEGYQF